MNAYIFHITLNDLALLAGIFTGLSFCLQLGWTRGTNRVPYRFLGLALFTVVLRMTQVLGTDMRIGEYLPYWSWLPLDYWMALGPLIFFFVLKITRPEYTQGWYGWLHFSPLLLQQGVLALEIRESLETGAATYDTRVFQMLNPVLQALALLSILLYLYKAFRLVGNYYRGLKFNEVSDRSRYGLRWLTRSLMGLALLFLSWILFTLVDQFYYDGRLGTDAYYSLYLVLTLMLIRIAAAAFYRSAYSMTVPESLVARLPAVGEWRQKGTWLRKAVESNLLFRDAELSLGSLAEKLDTNAHEVSRIINVGLRKNFNDFVNEYRIREVTGKMQDPAYDRLTLLVIAFDAGFNSKATFNRVFRQMTGMSPKEYKNRIKKERSNDDLRPFSRTRAVISFREPATPWSPPKINRSIMFNNYLKIAWRSMLNNKFYALLNIAGLTFGIGCFLLIGLYVFDELTFDQQHTKAARIYRVIAHKRVNSEATTVAAASYKLAEESKRTIAEVENTTRIQRAGRTNLINPENPVNFQETVTLADENLLKVFDFPLVSGDKYTALSAPNSIIIDENLALRLFGRTDVLGKTLKFGFLDQPLKITGVLKNLPPNSSLNFSSLLSEVTLEDDQFDKSQLANDWLSDAFTVYTLLRPGTDPAPVAGKLNDLVRNNFKPSSGTSFSFSLQPLKDVHLGSEGIVDGARNSNVDPIAQGSPFYIKIFSFVALFVLLIAGINYMNLTTARSSSRLKEIGVRKVAGAMEGHLMRQFLFESLLVTVISFILAVAAVNLVLPSFNIFVGKKLTLGLAADYRIWLFAVGFAVFTGLLSGSYPALLLSRFKPVLLLRGFKLTSKGDLSLRKGLVVFQFAISTVMIAGTIILFLQVRYLNQRNLGFNKNLLVVIDVNTQNARANFEAVKHEMAKIPAVRNVSVTSRVPGEWKSLVTVKLKNEGTVEDYHTAYLIGTDKDFLKTFEARLLKGRNFSSRSDSGAVLINETAARMLKITEPAGQLVEIPSSSVGGAYEPLNDAHIPFKARVIGIVRDFHFQSLRNKIEPLVMAYNENPVQLIDYYTVKIAAADIRGTLDKLKAVMVGNDKDDPFEYHFLDEQIASFYIEDHRRETMLTWAALSTIFIASLGLFGLATYSAAQRVKEIGVRKVLGATVSDLAAMLSKDFLKLVLIAIGIALPVAWWGANKWLQEYAYHIEVKWWMFGLAALAALFTAVATTSFQAIKAALANPVKSLRNE